MKTFPTNIQTEVTQIYTAPIDTSPQTDYGRKDQVVRSGNYITRRRMEKKDPAAVMSEPIRPIVFYIDPATPAEYVKWVKKGVEDWQPAFEAAGFRNAIVAREAPSAGEDPDWNADGVFRAGEPFRSAGTEVSAAGRSDGAAAGICGVAGGADRFR